MSSLVVNGINLSFDEYGSGEPVLLITGSGARGRMWTPHQVPALTAAGFRAITVDNRGMPPTDICPEGFTIHDMVADTVGLIEVLGIGPCRIVGFSLGGMMVQELLLGYPDLITQAVLIATRGRTDALRSAMSAADSELLDSGVVLPPRYAAVVHATQFLSPRTQRDERRVRDWLDIFEMSLSEPSVNRTQRGLELVENRLEEYRKIRARCLVVGFRDDLIAPPYLCREVAEHIPECRYEEIPGCGHYGYLEEPEAVNSMIINFFRES
ncbi:MAG TPA: alpha/beta hydrolase [Streptosporangiaceae bacterium]|nr:alpha/beta hydrolase [Streptosporangiaceae bacterium]